MQVNINTSAYVVLTDRLAQLSRSALPVAIRQTLNDAAFDVKSKTLDKSASKNFIRRAPTFFRAFSGVNRATGFNIGAMQAEVGMSDMGKPSAHTAIDHMPQQEGGGIIKGGADYLKGARAGSNQKRVTRSNYFDKNKLIKGPFKKKGTEKSNFIASVYAAAKQKKFLSINTAHGRYLMRVTSVKKTKKGKITINSRLMIKDRKAVSIRATHFSQEAAMMTYAKLPDFYTKEATKQIQRVWQNSFK
jgi:hypothetical protein